jgi:hypothetical protein
MNIGKLGNFERSVSIEMQFVFGLRAGRQGDSYKKKQY